MFAIIMLCILLAHMDEEPSIIQPVSVAPLLSASELRQKENEARREAMRNKKKTAVGKIGEDGWVEDTMVTPHYKISCLHVS